MQGKSLLITLSLLLVLGLGAGIGGLWEEARAERPEAPGEVPLLAEPVGTAFTYQGRLIKDGSPVDGTCDFGFTLWDSLGFEPIAFQSKPGVIVTDGLFTVELDFGAGAFQGDARWLETTVRCPAGTGFYTPISPHQALTATPYALYSLDADYLDGQHASAFATASHEHWGETWTGTGTGLTLQGGSTGLYGSGSIYGVQGFSLDGRAVYGVSSTGYGVFGNGEPGVYGSGDSIGVWGSSASGYGVYGSSSSGTAVYYDGGLAGTGSKSAIVETKDYAWRHLYAMESPEVWFEDFGTAQLVDGHAVVAIEPIFAQTVNLTQTYHVFLTPLGDCGLYVSQKSLTSFTVQALGGQACSIAFDYRIIAKRLGYEDQRLEPAEDPSIVAQEIQGEGP